MHSTIRALIVGLGIIFACTGCGSSGNSPYAAGQPTPVPAVEDNLWAHPATEFITKRGAWCVQTSEALQCTFPKDREDK